MMKKPPSPPERRSFITGLNAGVTSLAAMAIGGVVMAQEKSSASTRWEPARHDKDNWLDELPGKHRLVFDTITEDRLRDALLFANNFLIVNRNDYGLENKDLAIIVVARHLSTSYGYNNEMWAKYGASLVSVGRPANSEGKEVPKVNTVRQVAEDRVPKARPAGFEHARHVILRQPLAQARLDVVRGRARVVLLVADQLRIPCCEPRHVLLARAPDGDVRG